MGINEETEGKKERMKRDGHCGNWGGKKNQPIGVETFEETTTLILFTRSSTLGIHPPPRPPSPRRHHRALAQGPSVQIQLRQDGLPEM